MNLLGVCIAIEMNQKVLLVYFEGLARLFLQVMSRFVRGSHEISPVSSLHKASTNTLIHKVQAKYFCDACNESSFLSFYNMQ